MEIIDNNPYRILGVYANSPLRERVANASKARAFLKVGKSVSFPLDLTDSLHPLNRTEESFARAESSVALPSGQLRYALFWFIKMSVVDDVAMKNLVAGDVSAAEDVWRKRECMASAHNLIVYALVRGNLKLAVKNAEIFFSNRDYVSQFAQVVVGDDSSRADLATIFLDALCEEFNAEDVFYSLGDCELKEMASQKVTDKYVEWIEDSLSESRQVHGVECLKSGEDLLERADDWLSCLSSEFKTLSTSDIRYQSLCEKVSSEVIRCAQEYYQASSADEKAKNAMGLLSKLRRSILPHTKDENIKNNREFKWLFFMEEKQERQRLAEQDRQRRAEQERQRLAEQERQRRAEQERQRRAELEQKNVGAAPENKKIPQSTEAEEKTSQDDEVKMLIIKAVCCAVVCGFVGWFYADAICAVLFAIWGFIGAFLLCIIIDI